jgi:hypothetical protein
MKQHFSTMLLSTGSAITPQELLDQVPHRLSMSRSRVLGLLLHMVKYWKYSNSIVDQEILFGLDVCAGSDLGMVCVAKYGMICKYLLSG